MKISLDIVAFCAIICTVDDQLFVQVAVIALDILCSEGR
jgi:hypothetical protein